ncbi:hypothetical protein GCM10022234_00700 [Aeromicrobium panaciterrae]|uniref:hypothetical protein n=1 Tax=Aeromicrobium panaciterrae TaxID=363861 RepID=UPI0031CE1ADB
MTITDDQTVILEDLDFDPACAVVDLPERTDCTRPAEWIATMRAHCFAASWPVLLCDHHCEQFKNGATWRCHTCDAVVSCPDYILAIERIKP